MRFNMNETTLMSLLQKMKYFFIFLALATLLLWPSEAIACACCAETGTWFEITEKIDSSTLPEIKRLKFEPVANLYVTAQGLEGIKGIASPSKSYTLSHSQNQRSWNLAFKNDQGKTGNLSFPIPTTAESFGTDLLDGSQGGGGGPLLYKELRMEGRVAGNGIFAKGITSDTKYRLILQGRGNNCLNVDNFKSWKLQVLGSRASYLFYGFFKQLAP